MDSSKEINENIPKRKRPNFFSRLGRRIYKAFNRSKSFGTKSDKFENVTAISKSHDDLSSKDDSFKSKRKKLGNSLRFLNCLRKNKKRIPVKNERSLSEGNLTCEGDTFYSVDSSLKPSKIQSLQDDTSPSEVKSQRINPLFKNELASKLRVKNMPRPIPKDDESETSKTPDSPTGFGNGTSPSSTNSLLSGTVMNNYGTSDAESMSRSVIEEEPGINVDLATPISKTTTGSLLDSTAARQKLAAAKPRRARPKAHAVKSINIDKKSSESNGGFSPVSEKREILEEISEEDVQTLPSSSSVFDESSFVLLDFDTKSNVETKLGQSDRSSDDQINSLNISVPLSEVTSPKLHSLVDCKEELPKSNEATGGCFSPESSEISSFQELPSKSDHTSHCVDDNHQFPQTNLRKTKFDYIKTAESIPLHTVKLRPTVRRNVVSEFCGDTAKLSSPSDNNVIVPPSCTSDQLHVDIQSKGSRYTPMASSGEVKHKSDPNSEGPSNTNESSVQSHISCPIANSNNKRVSRVMDMVKNLECQPQLQNLK